MAHINNPEALAVGLHDRKFIRFGDFELKSGLWSPIYINLRGVGSIDYDSELTTDEQLAVRHKIEDAYAEQINEFDSPHHILGIPEVAFTATGLVGGFTDRSILQLRVKEKKHGEPVGIEGDYKAGQSVVLIDDLITTGGAKLEAKEKVEKHGLKVAGIAVLVDREQGGIQELANQGIRVEAAIGMSTLIDVLASERRIDNGQVELLKSYFAGDITERPTN